MHRDGSPIDDSPDQGHDIPVAGLTKLALVGGLVAVIVIFVLQNLDNVPVDFLSFGFDVPLILLLAIAAASGIVIRWLTRFLWARRSR